MSEFSRKGEASYQMLTRAKFLRSHQTEAEDLLWHHLRGGRLQGLKFRRQRPMGPYIVDFICYEQRLIIELDGDQHRSQMSYDQKRDAWLEDDGFEVLRFWNWEVIGQITSVLEKIKKVISPTCDRDEFPNAALSPNPSPICGRGAKSPLPQAGEVEQLLLGRGLRVGEKSGLGKGLSRENFNQGESS